MIFEPGKIYKVNQYFWFLFPTKETAAAAARVAAAARAAVADAARVAAAWASYWSKELGCNVSFLSEGDTLLVVEVPGSQVKVINQEGKSGWINFPADKKWTEKAMIEVTDGVPNDH